MFWRLRIHVFEGQHVIIFEHDFGRNLARYDFAEQAAHDRKALPFSCFEDLPVAVVAIAIPTAERRERGFEQLAMRLLAGRLGRGPNAAVFFDQVRNACGFRHAQQRAT